MKRILMADHVSADIKFVEETLGDFYNVTAAQSGEQALLLLKEKTPDLILLDINLPDKNGYEVMEELKKDQKLKEVPVIFLTAEADSQSEIKGLKMGAMDFIRKPFDPEIMRSRIEKVLKMTVRKKEFQNMALKDELTDLLNRRYMEKMLNHTDTDGEKGFFMLLDLDNFKSVNDYYGYVTGDKVLIRFARIMQELVGENNSVCRLGGDEFAVYFPGDYEKSRITRIAQKVIEEIEFEINELLLDADEFTVSASIGIAQKPEDGTGFAQLYTAADKALYFVKRNGKGNCHFYGDTADEFKEAEEESRKVDLQQIQRMIQEEEDKNRTYKVGYNRFKWMYGFVTQCMEQESQDAHIVLFSVHDTGGGKLEEDRVKKGIRVLEQAISRSLRWGDVVTRCGNTQYIALLLNASYENGKMVAERVQAKFKELTGDDAMTLTYEVGNVSRNQE